MQCHSKIGSEILGVHNDDLLTAASTVALQHHERWDGKGYPRALKGAEIPLQSRITAIAEAYDAMTIKSPYKRAIPPRKAYLEIRKNAGTQFDPELAKLFLTEVWPDLI